MEAFRQAAPGSDSTLLAENQDYVNDADVIDYMA